MKNVKYLGLIMIMALMLTGCGSTTGDKTNKEDNKPTAVNPPLETGYTGVKKIVYLDPTNLNKACTEDDVNSTDETKSGCMKWYAYKEDDNTYTMILDHNTTNLVNWIKEDDYIEAGGKKENITYLMDGRSAPSTDMGPITAEKQLESDTSYWVESLNPRLIKESEVREITGNPEEKYYKFDTDTNTNTNTSKYGWLYDRTSKNCEKNGCLNNATTKNTTTKTSEGYWTDTADDEHYIWYVSDSNCLSTWGTVEDVWEGIRPVITIQKSSLSFVESEE